MDQHTEEAVELFLNCNGICSAAKRRSKAKWDQLTFCSENNLISSKPSFQKCTANLLVAKN